MIVYANTSLNGHIKGLRKLSAFYWVCSPVYRFDESVCIYFEPGMLSVVLNGSRLGQVICQNAEVNSDQLLRPKRALQKVIVA